MNVLESTKLFHAQICEALEKVNPELLCDPVTDAESYADVYRFIAHHADTRKLRNTAIALPMARHYMLRKATAMPVKVRNHNKHIVHLNHALAVCRMLIDLHMPLNHKEEDILLATTLCHVMPEDLIFDNLESELTDVWTLDPEVYGMLRIVVRDHSKSEEEQAVWYDTIQQNKLALLHKLADRSNLIQSLVVFSSLSARNYIYETKSIFFPMCIYGKEHYPELLRPISVMMEKMRSLSEVTEILLTRYGTRELELLDEIQTLQEENALLRSMIQSLQ